MKVFLIAAVAVAISGTAFATDLKGTVMTDSEMDKVTAGAADPSPGGGTDTARGVANYHADIPYQGRGVCQTGASGRC